MPKIFNSCVVNAPIDAVWEKTRDFNALKDWHPAIAKSIIENNQTSDQVGCIREMTLQDGGVIRERLISLDDSKYSYSYIILESPFPIRNYVATLRLRPIVDGSQTFVEWKSSFDCAEKDEAELTELLFQAVYQGGFDRLKEIFSE